jgi:hypothetical protein
MSEDNPDAPQKRAKARLDAKAAEIAAAYRSVFNSRAGRIVLRDLWRKAGHDPETGLENPNITMNPQLEGAKEIIRHVHAWAGFKISFLTKLENENE